ncbi:MAG: GGDEF domain-containing protein, partial [Acidobacteriota bacterium]
MEEITTSKGVARRRAGVLQLAAGVLLPVLALVAILVAAGAPDSASSGSSLLSGRPWQQLGWLLIALAASLHRPWTAVTLAGRPAISSPSGSSSAGRPATLGLADPGFLGLGAMVLPALLVRHGVASAALIGALCMALGELARWLAARRRESGSEIAVAGPVAVFERAVVLILAICAAGFAERALREPSAAAAFTESPSAAVAPLVYLLVAASCAWALGRRSEIVRATGGPRRRRRERQEDSSPGHLREALAVSAPLAVDAAGWALGMGLTLLALGAGWREVVWLWPVLSILILEAARQSLLRRRSDRRIGTFERLQEAHERILAESSGMGGIAEQILVECSNILPVQWFQFELPTDDEGYTASWAAGPDGLLVEGRPRPPSRPEMLPGIHRRVHWRVLDTPLVRSVVGEEDELLATLRIWCDPRRIESGAERLFDTLLPQMAASVHRARLDREARLDPLTGVPVRRVLEANLQRGYRRACENGTPMSVIMCDIDFFKRVNDTWGHDAGDEALKLVSACLDSTRREDDLCCR